MKKRMLILLIIYCFLFVANTQTFAQKTEYQSIFGETNTSFNLYNFDFFYIYADSAYYVKDTTVNGMEYKKFDITRRSEIMPTENNRYLGMVLLRESDYHSKLYCYYPDTDSEYILMDLNLNLQDTFQENFVVDSIFYDDENRKNIVIYHSNMELYDCFSPCCKSFKFIEGVGPTQFIHGHCLLCAHKDLKHYNYGIWGNGGDCFYEMCDSPFPSKCKLSLEDSAIKNKLKIYPNPANSFIEIDLGENFMDYQFITIYDLLGIPYLNVVITQEKQQINIQNLPNGVYFIKIITKEKQPLYEKFTIIR